MSDEGLYGEPQKFSFSTWQEAAGFFAEQVNSLRAQIGEVHDEALASRHLVSILLDSLRDEGTLSYDGFLGRVDAVGDAWRREGENAGDLKIQTRLSNMADFLEEIARAPLGPEPTKLTVIPGGRGAESDE